MYLEENIEISKIELKKLVNFLPYPIIVAENDGNEYSYVFFNENFISKIGYSLNEAPTKHALVNLLYPDEDYRNKIVEKWIAKEKIVREKGTGYIKIKARITCKSGDQKWFEIKGSIVNNFHVIAFVNINNDIVLQEKLKKKNLNNDRMLSILGHDLRSPITNLISISSLGEQSEISQQEFISLMQLIKEESLEVLQLLDTTFNWVKLNFNVMQRNHSPIDFDFLISGILKVYKSTYENKGISITYNVAKLIDVKCDLEILTVIIRNLISNAIKFTPKDGLISISAEENKLIITDNGVGMTSETVDSILDNNYLTTRGTDNEKGIGVGLQLVFSLLEKINCRLMIKSEVSEGTSISIFFDQMKMKD